MGTMTYFKQNFKLFRTLEILVGREESKGKQKIQQKERKKERKKERRNI